MAFIPRNDEQIKVGTTPGLIAGAISFTFDGSTVGRPDYRGYEIVISEINNRGFLIKGVDYSWNYETGVFTLLQPGDELKVATYYQVGFQNPIQYVNPVNPDSLVTLDYFIRDIMIPNIAATAVSNRPGVEKINLWIQKYEKQCLKNILGYELQKKVYIESSQRIQDLVYGAEYTDLSGNLQKWEGLLRPTELISPIANYIYFFKEEYEKAHTAGVGTVQPKPEAGTAVSPGEKMALAWNFFARETREMADFLLIKKDDTGARVYPEFTYQQYYLTRNIARNIDSVFQF